MTATPDGAATLRIDKWLWHARLCKTRSLAARCCAEGLVSVDGQTAKPSQTVRIGSAITVAHGACSRALTVLALGSRRGPASEARALYLLTSETRIPGQDTDWEILLGGGPLPEDEDNASEDRAAEG